MLDAEEQSSVTSQSKVEIQSLSTRSYLDHTVVPILLDAMAVVARERCVSNVCTSQPFLASLGVGRIFPPKGEGQ